MLRRRRQRMRSLTLPRRSMLEQLASLDIVDAGLIVCWKSVFMKSMMLGFGCLMLERDLVFL